MSQAGQANTQNKQGGCFNTMMMVAAIATVIGTVLVVSSFLGAPTLDALQTRVAIILATATPVYPGPNAKATIEKVWIDFDIVKNATSGMLIHIKFTTEDLEKVQGAALAFFYDTSGNPLKDSNGKYVNSEGAVFTGELFVSNYYTSRFDDFQLFMPTAELDLDPKAKNVHINLRVKVFALATSANYATSDPVEICYNCQ